MQTRILIFLIISNVLWSAHPALGKLVLQDFSPAHGAFLRYSSALLAYFVGILLLNAFNIGTRQKRTSSGLWDRFFAIPKNKSDGFQLALLGLMTFCFSPTLQMTGLSESKAIDGALIIAMEPLISILMAWVFLGEALGASIFISLVVALFGFCLLSGLSWQGVASLWQGGQLLGNLLILTSLTGEASYSILGKRLLGKYPPAAIFGSALVVGVLALATIAIAHAGFPNLTQFTWPSLLAILWLGPLGTAASYLVWMLLLPHASVASLVLTIYIQPVFGTLWGVLFLNESLRPLQWLGGVLILTAVILQNSTCGLKIGLSILDAWRGRWTQVQMGAKTIRGYFPWQHLKGKNSFKR